MKKTITVKAWLAYTIVFAMFILAGCLIGCQKESNADVKPIGEFIGYVDSGRDAGVYRITYGARMYLVILSDNNVRNSIIEYEF